MDPYDAECDSNILLITKQKKPIYTLIQAQHSYKICLHHLLFSLKSVVVISARVLYNQGAAALDKLRTARALLI